MLLHGRAGLLHGEGCHTCGAGAAVAILIQTGTLVYFGCGTARHVWLDAMQSACLLEQLLHFQFISLRRPYKRRPALDRATRRTTAPVFISKIAGTWVWAARPYSRSLLYALPVALARPPRLRPRRGWRRTAALMGRAGGQNCG